MDTESDKRHDQQGLGPEGQRVQDSIQERSANDQASGGRDFEDYPGSGRVPVGDAPVHAMNETVEGPEVGVDLDEKRIVANPGDVPNAGQAREGLARDVMVPVTKPDELDKRSRQ